MIITYRQILRTDKYSQYAPLVWMFAGKTSINKICKILHRALEVIHNYYQKSYNELLDINKDVNIHQKHLYILALEVF